MKFIFGGLPLFKCMSNARFLSKLAAYASTLLTVYPEPPGIVKDFAGPEANVPTGYFLCDGRAISRSTYGVGDGSTTFNIPDARGRITAGLSTVAAMQPR